MSDSDNSFDSYRRRDRSAASYQPSPILAFALLVFFVIAVFSVLHYVHPVPVGGGVVSPGVTTTTRHHGPTTTLPRSKVHVQVANGTSTPGLAKTANNLLQTQNWAVLGPVNGKHTSATVIYYRPGFSWAAKKIARTLQVPLSSIRPLGTATPVRGSIVGDDVIVLLGPAG